jgi:hypothetical protein
VLKVDDLPKKIGEKLFVGKHLFHGSSSATVVKTPDLKNSTKNFQRICKNENFSARQLIAKKS